MYHDLNDDNFLLYAVKNYESPHYIMSEFESDLKRVKYIKRLFKKYKITGSIKDRLILNHLILLYNVFGTDAATRMLFFKIDKEYYHILKTFLIYLNYMPDIIIGINGKNIMSYDISVDLNIANILRQI